MSAGASGADGRKEASQLWVRVRDYDDTADLAALRACVVELQEWERSFEPAMPPGAEIADAYISLLLERCGTWRGTILLAEIGKEVVGYACVWGRVPSEEPDDDPTEYAFLADLLVRAAHRRKGVGRVWMSAVEAYARGCGAKTLRVRMLARNTTARSFYFDRGFGEQEIEMLKRL